MNPDIPKRLILCAPNIFEHLRARLPKRPIEHSIYAETGWLYWFGNGGHVRMMELGKPVVWICDEDRGFPFIKIRRRFKMTPAAAK